MAPIDIEALAAQLALVNTHCVCEAIAEVAPSMLAELKAAREVVEAVRIANGGTTRMRDAMKAYDSTTKGEA